MSISSVNPATGKTLRTYAPHSEEEVERRVALAAGEFPAWRRLSWAERSRRMAKAGASLDSRKAEWGRRMTLEMGKPIGAAVAEAEKCAWVCRYYAEHAEAFLAEEAVATDASRSLIRYEPLGPVLAVMPWNFPFWQVFRFAAPALMAGNVGLLKHASNVPDCALAIEEIFRGAGFPEGAFQTLLVGSDRVAELIEDPPDRRRHADGKRRRRRLGRALRGRADQEGGSGAGRQRSLHRDAERGPGDGGRDGGQGADDQQRPVLHRRQAIHRPPGGRRRLRDAVRRYDARARRSATRWIRPVEIGPLATPAIRAEVDELVRRTVAAGAQGPARREAARKARAASTRPPCWRTFRPGSPADVEEIFGPVASLFRVGKRR